MFIYFVLAVQSYPTKHFEDGFNRYPTRPPPPPSVLLQDDKGRSVGAGSNPDGSIYFDACMCSNAKVLN